MVFDVLLPFPWLLSFTEWGEKVAEDCSSILVTNMLPVSFHRVPVNVLQECLLKMTHGVVRCSRAILATAARTAEAAAEADVGPLMDWLPLTWGGYLFDYFSPDLTRAWIIGRGVEVDIWAPCFAVRLWVNKLSWYTWAVQQPKCKSLQYQHLVSV